MDDANIDENQKRSQKFDSKSVKKFKRNTEFTEDHLSGSTAPLKQISSVDIVSPHTCVKCEIFTYAFACQPCGHLCLCRSCSKEMVKKNCPMCAKKVLYVQEIFPATPFEFEKMEMIPDEEVQL